MPTKVDLTEVDDRIKVWLAAAGLVAPITELHGLDKYQIGGNLVAVGSTMTKVEQHIGHIIQVADWLLGV